MSVVRVSPCEITTNGVGVLLEQTVVPRSLAMKQHDRIATDFFKH